MGYTNTHFHCCFELKYKLHGVAYHCTKLLTVDLIFYVFIRLLMKMLLFMNDSIKIEHDEIHDHFSLQCVDNSFCIHFNANSFNNFLLALEFQRIRRISMKQSCCEIQIMMAFGSAEIDCLTRSIVSRIYLDEEIVADLRSHIEEIKKMFEEVCFNRKCLRNTINMLRNIAIGSEFENSKKRSINLDPVSDENYFKLKKRRLQLLTNRMKNKQIIT